jgi:hypothetical protein
MSNQSAIEEVCNNITNEMILFIWDYVLIPVLTGRVDTDVVPVGTVSHFLNIFNIEELNREVDSDMGIIAVITLECIPCIYNSKIMLIFQTNRIVSPKLQEQLAGIDQQKPLWFLFKNIFSGCSTMNCILDILPYYYEDRKDMNALWEEYMGLRPKKVWTPDEMKALEHGNTFESTACYFYEKIVKNKVVHMGMKIWEECTFYNNSPDLVIPCDIRTGKRGIGEIKCPSRKKECHKSIPMEYVTQVMAGMKIHNAEFCDFISFYIKPGQVKNKIEIMIQRIFFSEEFWLWQERGLRYFEKCCVNRERPDPRLVNEIVNNIPLFKMEYIKEPSKIKINENKVTFVKKK